MPREGLYALRLCSEVEGMVTRSRLHSIGALPWLPHMMTPRAPDRRRLIAAPMRMPPGRRLNSVTHDFSVCVLASDDRTRDGEIPRSRRDTKCYTSGSPAAARDVSIPKGLCYLKFRRRKRHRLSINGAYLPERV